MKDIQTHLQDIEDKLEKEYSGENNNEYDMWASMVFTLPESIVSTSHETLLDIEEIVKKSI